MIKSNNIWRIMFCALSTMLIISVIFFLLVKLVNLFPNKAIGYFSIVIVFSILACILGVSVENKLIMLSIIIFLPYLGCSLTLFFLVERAIAKKPYVRKADTVVSSENLILSKMNNSLGKVALYVDKHTNCPLIFGNSVVVFNDSKSYLKSIIYDIKNAEKYVLMEFYIMKEGSMFTELVSAIYQAIDRGVKVNVIVDFIGSGSLLKSALAKDLKKRGAIIKIFKSPKVWLGLWHNTRTHRKIVVIDGKAAYLGGINFSDDELFIKDSGMRFIGDTAKQIESMFYRLDSQSYAINKTDQYIQNGFIQPFTVSGKKIIEEIYLSAINCSEREVLIVTPYLTLSERMLSSIAFQRSANIKFKVIIPALSGKLIRSVNTIYAEKLSKLGCEIYYYNKSFIHQKMIIIDGKMCISGSPNFDVRSSAYQIESGVILYNNRAIEQFVLDFNLCLGASERANFSKKSNDIVCHIKKFFAKLVAYFV